jgi:hypothetical protein
VAASLSMSSPLQLVVMIFVWAWGHWTGDYDVWM